MRDLSKWSKKLRDKLKKSDDLQEYLDYSLSFNQDLKKREISRLTQLITEVELGLTLLKTIANNEPAESVSALLFGYRFPFAPFTNENHFKLIQNARFYLIRRKGRKWKDELEEYLKLPQSLRLFSVDEKTNIPQLNNCTIEPQRFKFYQNMLTITPPHKEIKVNLASSDNWYVKISVKGNQPQEIPLNIPQIVTDICQPQNTPLKTTKKLENSVYSITLEQLKETAQIMDNLLAQNQQQPENYVTRLNNLEWKIYNESNNQFEESTVFNIEQLVHIVGLLNVGKSTLLEILIYHLASHGYRCGLIVNDVVTSVRLASLFWFGLNIPSAPILGSDRSGHLKKVYEPLFKELGEDITQGGSHPARRWFSEICPLLSLVKGENIWEFGQEPCHQLYQKKSTNELEKIDDLIEIEDLEETGYSTCPFYYQCPHHQLEKDIANSLIWILTPASLIHSRVPKQVFKENIRFAEAVYRECDFLFIDEVDRVQVQLDEAFAPGQTLVDNSSNAFLNKLGLNFSEIYKSNRSSLSAHILAEASKAENYIQSATNLIMPQLQTGSNLVEWIGKTPFTGYSLFANLIREILEINQPEETEILPQKLTAQQQKKQREQRLLQGLTSAHEREQRQKLMENIDGFLKEPLNRHHGGELALFAHDFLSNLKEKEVQEYLKQWLIKWLKLIGITLKDQQIIDELCQKLRFAILLTVLHNRLIFLVDHLTQLIQSRLLDLHDLSQSLIHRPPRDYLPIIPSAPVGNILGFKYSEELGKKGGKLEYFRYVGVGRYLLLNFPYLWQIDNLKSPKTVLISGTSYVPNSPSYHLIHQPTILLVPHSNHQLGGDAGIRESKFNFSPQEMNGYSIKISGLPPKKRKKATEDLVKIISTKKGKIPSFLDDIFTELKDLAEENPELWEDRQRILLLTNSYDEADFIEKHLQTYYKVKNIDQIACLRRDHSPANLRGIRRGQIRDLKNTKYDIVVAPLMALERGHNILNDQQKAAFGCAIFMCRPMPIPDDWQNTVQQLNYWAINHEQNPALYKDLNNPTLAEIQDRFYRNALIKLFDLNCQAMSFQQLNDEERRVLCLNQFVSIWQVIGRLVRGGVPCLVHFLDAKFAPESTNDNDDSHITSLLVGIIQQLELMLKTNHNNHSQNELVESLYGAFLHALKSTENLNIKIIQ